METVKIERIVPDKNQPRKLFGPERLAELKTSVKDHGILNPIVVEKMTDGNFLIVDGERRYRVATQLGLKEVPVIVIKPQSQVDRLIQQFHIQEQHEGWTLTEKALALETLAKEANKDIRSFGKVLGISERVFRTYLSFLALNEREIFQQAGLSIQWAEGIKSAIAVARRVAVKELDKELTGEELSSLEKSLIERISKGQIVNQNEFVKLKASFHKDPKSIKEFMHSDMTIDGIFLKSKAQDARTLLTITSYARSLGTAMNSFMVKADSKVLPEVFSQLNYAKESIDKFLTRFAK